MNELSPQILAAATSLAVHFRTALSNQAVIDQAIGVLRSRGSSAEDALTRLRTISEGEDVGLVIVAHRVVAEAIRRSSAPPPG
jgi:hypothetical protein